MNTYNMSRRDFLSSGFKALGGIVVATAVPTFLTGCGKGKGKQLNLRYDLNDNYSKVLDAESVPVNTENLIVQFGNYEAEIPGGTIDNHLFGFVRWGNKLFAMENPTNNLKIYDEKQAVLEGNAVLLGELSRYPANTSRVNVHGKDFGVLLPVRYIQEQLPVGVHQGKITLKGVEFGGYNGYLFAKTLDEDGKFQGLYAFERPIPEVQVKGLELIIVGDGNLILGSEAGKFPRTRELKLLISLPDEKPVEQEQKVPEVEAPAETKPAEAQEPQFLIEPREAPRTEEPQQNPVADDLIEKVDKLMGRD